MEIGDKLSNRYLIIDVIGQGGMANVFLARDLILEREVAVKVLRFDFQDNHDAIRRFQREAMSASQLLHHNIVEIYDVDEQDEQQYIVMEYVKGTDLKTYIRENAPLSLELVVSIMSQILSAIDVAHRNQIIHRDIKPQNILITDKNEVKITDFGIAVALSDTSITQTNTLLGSVHYLSPEQARGSNATTKSDLYALGVVLYELITGSVPYDGESAVSVALKHFQEPFPRIKDKLEYVPQSLENVVLKATAKESQYRYQTVQDMLVDLSTSLNTNRLNEPMYEPTIQTSKDFAKPIKPIPANKEVQRKVVAPDPLDRTMYPPIDDVAPITPAKRSYRPLLWLSLILVIVVGSVAGYYLINQTVRYVSVPDVSYMSEQEAVDTLKKASLSISKTTKSWSETVPEGDVIETTPESGTKVTKNSSVELVVSNGKAQVEIGDYVGQEYEAIRRELRDMNFIVTQRGYATNSPSEAGKILAQSIAPGTKVVPDGTAIEFRVGNYAETAVMQDFFNLPLDMVNRFAEMYGVNVEVSEVFDDYIPEGQVVRQDPENGTALVPGDTISVTISKGREKKEEVSVVVPVTIEYFPTYADSDVEHRNPLPNKIQVFIGDAKNNINKVYDEFTISKTQQINITLYLNSNGVGQYRVLRNGEVIAESNEVLPSE